MGALHVGAGVRAAAHNAHRGGRGQTFVYELVYDGQGQDGAPFLAGLLDVERLRGVGTTATLGGQEGGFGEPLGAHTASIPAGLGSAQTVENGNDGADFAAATQHHAKSTDTARNATAASYAHAAAAIALDSDGV